MAFLEDRTELRVIDVKSKQVNTALDKIYNYSYTDGDVTFQWSPDSQWFLVDYIAPADGTIPTSLSFALTAQK